MNITDLEWKKIQRRLSKLDALEAGGVDTWDWYSNSLDDWFKENQIDELTENFIDNLNDIIAEAEVDEPAGRGCGYSIKFDEDVVSKMFLEFAKEYKEILEG